MVVLAGGVWDSAPVLVEKQVRMGEEDLVSTVELRTVRWCLELEVVSDVRVASNPCVVTTDRLRPLVLAEV